MRTMISWHKAQNIMFISTAVICLDHLSVNSGIIMMFELQRLKPRRLIHHANGKLVLQSTSPTSVFFEKGQKFVFYNLCFTIYPCLLYLLRNFTHGMLHHTN